MQAAIEPTPWGPFDFPPPIRSQREAQAIFDEARVPLVVAVRFLAATDSADAPWVTRHLACGSGGTVRKDLAKALVRTSTEGARQLVEALDGQRHRAAEQRAGGQVDAAIRYPGPVAIVLEPVRISRAGEPLAPPVVIEPHLRIFVTASVPRCDDEATGAYGRLGELPVGFMVTASTTLELGWPTSAPGALGHRIVMATDSALVDGFCCGQEANFALESLMGVYDFRDYRTKSTLRATLRTLASARQRDDRWKARVREAFGLPDRYPSSSVENLQFGSGRVASGEFTVWPARGNARSQDPAPPASLADIIMALAWHAHSRAELLSPAILESYDPERKYSFVGWPEEFRETATVAPDPDAIAPVLASGKVLEVFGADRKLSFVGKPEAIADNVAFGFAAWKAEIDLSEREVTRPFIAEYSAEGAKGRAARLIAALEAEAAARRLPRAFRSEFSGAARGSEYGNALRTLDGSLRLPGLAMFNPLAESDALAGKGIRLEWGRSSVHLPADSAESLRAGLLRLYRSRFREQLGRDGDGP